MFNTSTLVRILLILWKIFNVSTRFKGICLNDNFSTPLTLHNESFMYLARIVYWLDTGSPYPAKANCLADSYGFSYV